MQLPVGSGMRGSHYGTSWHGEGTLTPAPRRAIRRLVRRLASVPFRAESREKPPIPDLGRHQSVIQMCPVTRAFVSDRSSPVTPCQDPPGPTDQKVGGSNPSERAQSPWSQIG